MATIPEAICRAVQTKDGSAPAILHQPEAATQTFVKGEVVFMSAGYLNEIASNTPALIYGVAADDGSNSASGGTSSAPECPVFLADDDTLFEANVKQSGSDHVLAATDLGVPMGIYRDTGDSKIYLDADVKAGTGVRVFTHRVARGTAIGDTNGRVLFNFLPNWVQFLGTS